MKKNEPIRMCIACRSRIPQKTLIRLTLLDNNVIAYNGQGRSFYLCSACVEDGKKIRGLAKRFKQEPERLSELLLALAEKAKLHTGRI